MGLGSFINKIRHLLVSKPRDNLKSILWRWLGLKWELRSDIIVKIECHADWTMYNDIFVNKEYDPAIEQALKYASHDKPFNVLDLGANVGFFAFRVADKIFRSAMPHIDLRLTLVEGNPAVCKNLKSRSAQPVFGDKIRIVNGLIGERRGSAKISDLYFHPVNSIFSDKSAYGIEVKYADLFSLYDKNSAIDLLKCDIEGSEQRFLENYKELISRIKCAVFEFHHLRCDVPGCFEILKKAGLVNYKQLRKETENTKTSTSFFWR